MKRITLFSIILVLAVFSISAKTDYYELVDSAEANIKAKNWAKAEGYLKELLTSYPDNHNNSLILSNLATVQRYQGKYREAINNYSYAINMTPNAVTLIKNRASLYLDLDSIEDARDDYERLLLIDEKDEESRYYHGILSIRVGDMDAAKKDFDYILFYNPASGLGREGLAMWYKQRKDYVQAIQYYTELIKHRPTAIHLSNRAECYLAMKRLNNATNDIREALELEPEDGYLYLLRAKLNKLRYNNEDVERDVKLAEQYGIDRQLAKDFLDAEK